VLRYAIDDLTADVTRAKLGRYAGGFLALALAGGVFRFLMRRIIVGVSRAIEYDLRNVFFGHVQRLPLAYFHANRTGDLMSRATNDLNAVRMMVGPAIMSSSRSPARSPISRTCSYSTRPRRASIPTPNN
jgi:ATP-binding cassette subfamily B protein